MINSMTAFCEAERVTEKITISAEIRSYNNRYLDISLRIPSGYSGLEEPIKSLISEKISRGRIELRLQITETADEVFAFEINKPKATAYYNALVQLKELLNLESDIPLTLIAGGNGIIKPADIERDTEAVWIVIKDCLTEALDGLNAMRKTEGDFIAADFETRLKLIETCIETIEKESHGLVGVYQERLKERIAALTKGLTEIDPARIAQEAAFLADRSDICEEITRAKSHIQQFRFLMKAPEPSGRKLNFLLQELNREFNTMGMKSANASVSYTIVEVKSELEKIREQVQNIE